MNEGLVKTGVMLVIRVSRRLFYNTPIHRLKVTGMIYHKLFHIAYPPGAVIPVQYEGVELYVPTDDITILPSLLSKSYERAELRVLRNVLKPGMTFVDVGANVGLYSVLAGQLVGDCGSVYAFEPEPGNFALLARNIEVNGLRNVRLERAAVGAFEGSALLYKEKGSIGTHSLIARKDSSAELEVDVPVLTLDRYFRAVQIPVDVIKVDVEGYEVFVLQGATEVLKQVQYLFVEYTGRILERDGNAAMFRELLESFPYIYRVSERNCQLYRILPEDFSKIVYANLVATRSVLLEGSLIHDRHVSWSPFTWGRK